MRISIVWGLLGLALVACRDDGEVGATNTGTEEDTSAGGSDAGGTTTGAADTGPGGGTDTEPVCGDGTVDPGELCDDGNDDDDDACSNDCKPACGLAWEVTGDQFLEGNTVDSRAGLGLDAEGNIFVSGIFEGTDEDIWVTKYDPMGNELWVEIIDGAMGDDGAHALAVTATGDVAVAGFVESADGSDVWASLRAGADGAEIWAITHDGAFDGSDEASGVAIAPNGNVVLSGTSFQADGDSDVWVSARAAADGSEVWTTTHTWTVHPDYSLDRGNHIVIDDDTGNIFVTARKYVAYDTLEHVLIKLDESGTVQWENALLETGDAHKHDPLDMAIDSSGAPYSIAANYDPGYNAFLIAHDPETGDARWTLEAIDIPLPGENGDDLYMDRLAVGTDGRLIVYGGWTNDEVGRQEVWIRRYGADGTADCLATAGVENGLSLLTTAATPAPDGGAIAAGVIYDGTGFKRWLGRFRP